MSDRSSSAGGREAALVAALALAATVLLTFPLAIRLDRMARVDSGDGQFAIWNVAWVARTLVADPARLFDANIFYPATGTLAYSEANLGAGVAAIPAYWLSGSAILAHNVVVILAFAAAAAAFYYLARHLGASRPASAAGALSFAFCPFVFGHLPHIQLLMTAGLPLSLLAMHRLVERPTLARSAALGGLLAAQGLFSAYYGIFAGLAVGLGILYYAVTRGRWTSWRYWALAVFAALVSAAIVAPFFIPFRDIQAAGFDRPLDEARRYAANLPSFLASGIRTHRWLLPLAEGWKETMFPGLVATVAGVAGLAIGLAGTGRTRRGIPAIRETTGFYGLLGGLAVWMSFGPAAGLYTVLYYVVPIFSFLRAPSRVAIVIVLALSILAAIAATSVIERVPAARRRPAYGLLIALAVVDGWAAPLAWPTVGRFPAAHFLLATLPDGAVVEFPFFATRNDLHDHSRYMLLSTAHWKPLVNGYSDHWPPSFREDAIALSHFPDARALTTLEKYRPRYLVFHLRRLGQREREDTVGTLDRLRRRGQVRALQTQEDVLLYEVVGWPLTPD